MSEVRYERLIERAAYVLEQGLVPGGIDLLYQGGCPLASLGQQGLEAKAWCSRLEATGLERRLEARAWSSRLEAGARSLQC